MHITDAGDYTISQVETTPQIYRISEGYPSGEYLLIENRQPVGSDAGIPQGGLAIWHIDEDTSYRVQGYPGQSGWPQNNKHYRVSLLQADGNYDLERNVNAGDAGDLYHGNGVSATGSFTLPNTDSYQAGNIRQRCSRRDQLRR
jgi:hypothetical protein